MILRKESPRKAQDRAVALSVEGDSILSLAFDHQLSVRSNWRSGSGWAIESSSATGSDPSSHAGG